VSHTARARNVALPAEPPEWVELLPPGPDIVGQDGRSWTLKNPDRPVKIFQRRQTPLVIDWEHATEVRAPAGQDAPAAAWVTELEIRDGAVWGRAEWTERAAQQIRAREYRYLSPVFLYEKDSREIIALDSAGLTNRPNLPLTALNREEAPPMTLPSALLAALSLPDTASEADAVAAVSRLCGDLATARNRAETPPLEKFVPRADYDGALARAANAENRLREIETAQRQTKIDGLIDGALKNGQIVPATRDYYVAMCRTEGGVEAFEKFLQLAPAVLGAPTKLDGAPAPAGGTPEAEFAANAALQAEFHDVAQYKAYKAAEAAGRVRIARSNA